MCVFVVCVCYSAWTESTRSCILSGSVAMQGETAEIDREIEHKLPEFNKLDTAGQGLMEKGNQLAEIVSEIRLMNVFCSWLNKWHVVIVMFSLSD